MAEMWRDQIRVYRYERQLKCVEKAERMARKRDSRRRLFHRRFCFRCWKAHRLKKTKICTHVGGTPGECGKTRQQ